jgi:hypothetical protein
MSDFQRTIKISSGMELTVYGDGFAKPRRPAAQRGKLYPEYEAFDQLQPGEWLHRPEPDTYTQRDSETFWAPKFRDRVRKRFPNARTHCYYNYAAGGLLFTFATD